MHDIKKVRNTTGSVYCLGQLVIITGILMHLCENKSKECNNFAILDVTCIVEWSLFEGTLQNNVNAY